MTAMRDNVRGTLLSVRDLIATAAPFVFLTAALLFAAYLWLDPTPPRTVVLATGQDQGGYAEFGKRYVQLLKESGVAVQLRKTAGAAENIAPLREPGGEADIAFVQGGVDDTLPTSGDESDVPDDGQVSLGSLFYEPVWLFYRGDSAERLLDAPQLTNLTQLAGWRVSIGAPGSGVPNVVNRLLEANRIERATITLLREPQMPSVVALLDGGIDAVVFASAPEALLVQMLLQTPGIRLFDFVQAEAYSRRFPFLSPVTLPRGVVDLARDIPPADVRLVAPTATLVARKRTHPALLQLFMQAAQPRIFRWYRRLRDVEGAIGQRRNEELLRELQAIERHVEQVHVALSYADELYSLRTHIHMVAERLIAPVRDTRIPT
jgi:TRAP-type uncharacterized transport system substrate-binding protein